MESYDFLWVIAVILLSTKVLGLISERVHMPQVVGALLAGVILGPSVLGLVGETDFLTKSAELGVIILMFMAGLDTDLDELKKTGAASFVIALAGVLVPLAGGTAAYLLCFHDSADPYNLLRGVFIGVVLSATSVSITVETLREMGKLHGKVGTAILGAAIIDDIMGIIVLTVVSSFTDPTVKPLAVLLRIGAFFVFLAVVAFVMHRAFQMMDRAWGGKRRLAIYAVAFALVMAYCSETLFGVADITGAYAAGLMLCNIAGVRDYVAKKVTVLSYLMFSPLFFASIGIKTELSGMDLSLLKFAVLVVAAAVLCKIIGCGLSARALGFSGHDSLVIGCGMVARGEVALVVAQKGQQAGLIDSRLFPALVLMVIVAALITPILLKVTMRNESDSGQPKTEVAIRHQHI